MWFRHQKLLSRFYSGPLFLSSNVFHFPFAGKPMLVMKENGIRFVSVGGHHVLVVLRSKQIFGWGSNSNLQLGLPNFSDRPKPVLVCEEDVSQVFCGHDISLLLTKEGRVLSFGEKTKHFFSSTSNVTMIPGNSAFPLEWRFDNHSEFDPTFHARVFYFLICQYKVIPPQLKLPKPILSIILNFAF